MTKSKKIFDEKCIIDLKKANLFYGKLKSDLKIFNCSPNFNYIDSKRNNKLIPINFLYENNKDFWLKSFLLKKIKIDNYEFYDIESSYGYGHCLSNNNDHEFLKKAFISFKTFAKKNNILCEFYRLHPLINNKFYNGNVNINRKVVIINLKKNLFEQYNYRKKTDIKFSLKKNVELEISQKNETEIEFFINGYENFLKKINANKFYFFESSYYYELLKREEIKLFSLKYDEKILSQSIIIDSKQSKNIEYHFSYNNVIEKKIKATETMIHLIAERYQKIGYKNFYLGGGRSISKDDNLFYFKSCFSKRKKNFYIGYDIFDEKMYYELKSKFSTGSKNINFYNEII